MKLRTDSQNGFTLVELMVVVGIVGVLSAVAMSNYQHFVAKARQTEAKVGLAGVYIAESSFFAENNSYTGCLRQAGYVPEGTTRYYIIGFSYYTINGNNTCGPAGDQPCARYSFSGSTATCNASDPNHVVFPAPLNASDIVYSASAAENNGSYYHIPLVWHLDPGQNGLPTAVSNTAFLAGAAGAIAKNAAHTALTGEPNNVNSGACCDGWTIDQNRQLINTKPGI